jgi:hypothetical protein
MKRISDARYKKNKVYGHYFLDLSVDNLRCFGRKQTLSLANKFARPEHWTIILGDNGTGKTSLLKAIISVAPSPKNILHDSAQIRLYPGLVDWHAEWDTRRMDSKTPSKISAEVIGGYAFKKLVTGSKLSLSVTDAHLPTGPIQYNEAEYGKLQDFLCFAYGASRHMGNTSLTGDKYSRPSVSLFDDDAPLINVEEFFMRADYDAKTSKSRASTGQRDKVKALLIDILPDVRDLRISKGSSPRQVEVKTSFGWVRLSELSLGYKSLIAWLVDFASRMYHYHRTAKNPFLAPAVVLIDEIDLHMHPTWQRKILSYLSRKFPNTQFIATAHSPLIVQAALGANLVLLKRRGAHVTIDNAPEVIKNWRIDQILTSDMFGLSSARGESTEKLLNRRRKLLMRPKLSRGAKRQLNTLEEKLGTVPVAETPEYIHAMQIVDKASKHI